MADGAITEADFEAALAQVRSRGVAADAPQPEGITEADFISAMGAAGVGAPRKEGPLDYGAALMNAFNAGIPFSDEITSGMDTAAELLATPTFGGIPLSMAGDYYNALQDVKKRKAQAFAAENPKTAMGLGLAGSVGPNILATMAGGPVLGSAAMGGLYGAGEGENLRERLINAAVGTAAGGVLGKAFQYPLVAGGILGGGVGALTGDGSLTDRAERIGIGALTGTGLAYGAGKLAQPLINYVDEGGLQKAVGRLLSEERGAIGDIPTKLPPEAGKGALYVARQLRDRPEAELKQAIATLTDNPDVPLTIADVFQTPRVERAARMLVNESAPSEQIIAGEAFSPRVMLKERIKQQAPRIEGLLDDLTPERNPAVAGAALKRAVEENVAAQEAARSATTGPMYKALPPTTTPAIQDALTDPIISREAQLLANDPVLGVRLGSDPTDPRFLVQLRKVLREKAANLRSGEKPEKLAASTIEDAYHQLTTAMKDIPGFEEANVTYRSMSEPIGTLTGEGGGRGIAKEILGLKDLNSAEAGAKLFNMEPADALQLKAMLGNKGEAAMNKGVRAYLSGIMRDAKEGRAVAPMLLDSTYKQDLARAALGETKYNSLIKKLDLEKQIVEQTRKFAEGSSTRGNFAAKGEFDADMLSMPGVSGIEKAVSYVKDPRQAYRAAIDWLARPGLNEQAAQEASRIMFDRQAGLDFLQNVYPTLVEVANRRDLVAQRLAQSAAKTGAFGAVQGKAAFDRRGQ